MTAKTRCSLACIALAAAMTACSDQAPPTSEPMASGTTAGAATPATAQVAAPATEPASSRSSAEHQALLARGDYLMNGVAACGNCHTPRDENGELIEDMELAGAFVIEEPGFRAYAPNITPDVETGIGSWSDEEIIRAVREGIRRDGSVMGPPMGYIFFREISDRDMQAIVAYLRSVPAVRNEVPRSTYNIPMPPDWGPELTSVPEPDRNDQVAYGRYLAHTVGHCTDCHTPLVQGQHDFTRIGAGGNLFPQPFGQPYSALAANITQHEELGIGAWTDEEIKRAITEGVSRDGRELLPFMAFDFYANISDEDLDAIVAYLRTLPPATAVPPQENAPQVH